jgi:transcriptional regulator with GAF, ATPase, and Fis domain
MLAPHLFLLLESDQPLAPSIRFRLDGIDAVSLGRTEGQTVSSDREENGTQLEIGVPDLRMSASHAVLRKGPDAWSVEDAQSKNGTLINGRLESRATLADGDLIELGHTFFLFREALATLPAEPSVLRSDELQAPVGLLTLLPSLASELKKLQAIAVSAVPVILQGETGTGKEILASAVHRLSQRSGPFLPINCGGLPENLLESELFGSRKGAFTGAEKDRPGLVRSADHGTLFLDEIGELSASAQAALLRVLQDGEILPVGATQPIRVDIRILAATNRDLDELVSRDRFRDDLVARISGFSLWLPPLRERREDLGVLIAALLQRPLDERASKISLSCDAARALLLYDWPLNIRELEKCLASAVVLSGMARIELDHLPVRVRAGPTSSGAAVKKSGAAVDTRSNKQQSLRETDRRRREELLGLLREHRGNISAVARALGKARIQVQRWIKRYRIDRRAPRN